MDKLRNIEKWKIFTILGVLVVVVFILIEIENMYISRKWDDSLGELLVGTTLEVKDEDEHNLTEEIESADQIKVVELDLKHVGILKIHVMMMESQKLVLAQRRYRQYV